jgi:hypothetical protein
MRRCGSGEVRREAHADVVRVIELSEEGYSPSTIAASVRLKEDLVREILEQAEAARAEAGGP